MEICRLCLFEGNSKQITSVLDNEIQDLAKKIKDCVSIDIEENDRLPMSVCFACVQHVIQWENFKDNCQKSNSILLQRLFKDEVIFENENFENHDLNKDEDDSVNGIKMTICEDKEWKEYQSDNGSEEYEEEDKKTLKIGFFEEFEDIHLKSFISNNIYKCDYCPAEFDNCFEYLDHQETHDGQPVFSCEKCREVFRCRKDLVSHDQNHKVPCSQCGKMILKSSMKMHLIIHTDKFKCDKCGGTFNSKSALATHTIQVHTNIKNHVCDSCGKLFSCQASLKVHLRIHSNERLYKCKECNYSGRTASALYAHMATHANDLRVCEYCPKTFKSSRNLGDHLRRVHSKEKKHECSYCNKKFVDKYMLSVHKRWHTGDRPYKCTLCEKAFIRSDGLKEHMETHKPRTKFNCNQCGKKFTTKRSVVRHNCSGILTN